MDWSTFRRSASAVPQEIPSRVITMVGIAFVSFHFLVIHKRLIGESCLSFETHQKSSHIQCLRLSPTLAQVYTKIHSLVRLLKEASPLAPSFHTAIYSQALWPGPYKLSHISHWSELSGVPASTKERPLVSASLSPQMFCHFMTFHSSPETVSPNFPLWCIHSVLDNGILFVRALARSVPPPCDGLS